MVRVNGKLYFEDQVKEGYNVAPCTCTVPAACPYAIQNCETGMWFHYFDEEYETCGIDGYEEEAL